MKKLIAVALCLVLALSVLSACGAPAASSAVSVSTPASSSAAESTPAAPRTAISIAGLKGPTTMGMVNLMADAEAGTARHDYTVNMYGTADEITPLLLSGELDAAMVPCNLASILYNKTNGEIQVAAVNTLGVLYVVETGDTIHSVADLKGKTIYSTGKGTTPEYLLNYILEQNGLAVGTDVTVEFKSEATEVAAMLAENADAVAMLPQPYVTAVQMQNENVRIALDMTQEWNTVSPESAMVTGVLVVRKSFAAENAAAFAEFLEDYAASIAKAGTDVEGTANLIAQYEIVAKAPIAQKALPLCNITYADGTEMKNMVSGYLQVLFDQNPQAVGGTLPDEAFYYAV